MNQRTELETAREFLERMYYELREDYKFRGVKYNDLCDALATTIGKRLILAGQLPHLEKMVKPPTRARSIIPIRFKDQVHWGLHVVCVCEDRAWDPVLGVPWPIADYSRRLLGEKLPLMHYKSTEQLREFSEENILIDFN